MARMMSIFPIRVTMYMMKNRAKSGFWSSGWEDSPRKMNSETLPVLLTLSIILHVPVNMENYRIFNSTSSNLFPSPQGFL